MKILMATMGLDIGGAETHILELTRALLRQGHEVVLVSRGGVYVEQLQKAGAVHYEAPLHSRSFSAMKQARRILKEVILREKPQVVHAHARIPAFLCGNLQKKLGFPFVVTAHGVYNARGILRCITDWGRQTLAVSEDIRDYLMREYSLPAQQILVTVNGIDTARFSPDADPADLFAELQLSPGGPVVSCVSRMDDDSVLAPETLLACAPALAERVSGVQLVIAGGGTHFARLREQAEQINRRLGRPCVILTGPRTDIERIVALGDVFVGVSRAALEAMSAGKPVIVAGNEGYHGLFSEEKLPVAREGNFCCRGLPLLRAEQLTEDLAAALSLPAETRAELGAYGRSVVQKYYSVEKMMEDALTMYHRARNARCVVMSGYYGFGNAGDDAILQAVVEGIRAEAPEISLTVLSKNPGQTRALVGTQAVHRFRWRKVTRALGRSDALLFGGGSLLQDATSTRSLLYYLRVIAAAHRRKRPVMLFANGIGPVTRAGNRRRVQRAVSRATVVSLRDAASAEELRRMGVYRDDLHVTADPVFRLHPAEPARVDALLQTVGLAPQQAFFAVSVREWPETEAFSRALAAVCDWMQESYRLPVLFLMMQPVRDGAATARVRESMKTPSLLLTQAVSPREIMGILGRAKLCLAMRLHTLIFAARMAVPTLGLVYDPKVESFLKELSLPSAGWVTDFSAEKAIDAVGIVMQENDAVRQKLQSRAAALEAAAGENIALLLAMLRGEIPAADGE